ncbi:MAG: hypothetical protein MJZ81_08465 [Bacteroidales bacterium]|nr:hypothetical protein [Bacteroidales bacterium]
MKRSLLISLLMIFFQPCFSQDLSVLEDPRPGWDAYQVVTDYIEARADQIVLSSIIEVNGIVHPRDDTYGYIRYVNGKGVDKKCPFQYLHGIIRVSEKDFDEIIKLPDTTLVEVAICLMTPVYGNWGSTWDMVMVKGTTDVRHLTPTRSRMSPGFHFKITSLGKKHFKIRLCSWGDQISYYSVGQRQMSNFQKRRLDRKEKKIYKISVWPNIWGRKLW